jgi:1-acyl-sn-glycerol-3-phosphate acyltransferase
MKQIGKLFLWLAGWKVVNDSPTNLKKAVMVCAPHTSNWDFPFGLAAFYLTPLKVKYFIKKSWFFFPMNLFFRYTGGVPIDRSKSNGLVAAMTDKIRSEEELIIAISPEGTRSRVPKWKTGFYHIALEAKAPLLMSYIDYKNKEVGFGPVYNLTGDIDVDMNYLETFFIDKTPKIPKNFNSKIYTKE